MSVFMSELPVTLDVTVCACIMMQYHAASVLSLDLGVTHSNIFGS